MKKIISVLIALSIIFSLVGCRNLSEDISDSSSEVLVSYIETVESKIDGETASQDTVSQNSSTVDTSPEQNVPSSSQNASSNQSNTSIPTNTIKPYTGNLPSISKGKIPQFSKQRFELSGFWAPYEISEKSFKQYKDAGFTTLAMINHSLENTSEGQFYLGSERTMNALKICKKVGLKAILNYNGWKAEDVEGAGYYGETPFSTYDIYGDYKDIITGIHICDEPQVKHIPIYSKKTLIDDFKKVYPNAKYIVNLLPLAIHTGGYFNSYAEMMEIYEENFMEPFDSPFVSVDIYPFHQDDKTDDALLAANYEYIANTAKKYGIKPTFILQASTGNEFEKNLSESDLRWEINAAIAFGANALQYYCYSVPRSYNQDGSINHMYDYCILKPDDTPSGIYYSLQKLHKEIQSFASVILSYDWDKSIGVSGSKEAIFRVSALEYDEDYNREKFDDAKHYVSATATQDLIVSRFTSQEYGESYMFVNFADRNNGNTVAVTLRDCKAVAIYGGVDYSGTPQIVSLDEEGNLTFDLDYGEGVFVIPLV